MARHTPQPNTTTSQRINTSTEAPLCDGIPARAHRRPMTVLKHPARKIYPCLLSDIEKEMLVHLAESAGTTMCATIRLLIRRECATSGVV